MGKRSKAGRPDKARRPDVYWRSSAEGFGRDTLKFITLGEEEQAYWSARFAFRCASFVQGDLGISHQRVGDEVV